MISLNAPLAANSPANPDDVRTLKRVLNRLGYYAPPAGIGITEIPDRAVFDALKDYQRDHNLLPTGEIAPDDPILLRFQQDIDRQVKENDMYIWETVGDGKVRASHAALDGTRRQFGVGLEPGDDPNCRCSAKLVPIPKKKPTCDEQKEALNTAEQRLYYLQFRREKLKNELKALIEKNNEIVKKMQDALGVQIASYIISLPIKGADIITELLQRVLGGMIGNEALETANRLALELNEVKRNIQNKKLEFIITLQELEIAKANLKSAQDELEQCRKKIPGQ